MAGVLSKDTTLGLKASGSTYTELEYLMEVPEIGGDPEKVEVTTLKDGVKKYIPGIKDLGDLSFNFLYDNSKPTSNYRVLSGLQTAKTLGSFQLTYPDGTKHAFDAYVSVKMGAAAVNGALTFTANMSLQSDITVTHPPTT
ncbi:phage tail tube protein [Paenibacillus sp. FSL E2-0190]|uniref:phage tail tube protein n=1 Tax=Paenibacillus sp. FSL E2-0190 TaxID=2954504 RepID=UPI0030EDA661